MNVFAIRPEMSNGRVRLLIAGDESLAFDYAEAEIGAAVRAALSSRRSVMLGIRPHAIRLGQPRLKAKVVSNQWLGDQSHIAAAIAGQTIVIVAHQRIDARVGEEIPFDVAGTDLHLFAPDTGSIIVHGGNPK